jgi:peptidoglycan/xylan/chitin deacetylase (PgdA/CDA1 family)
MPKLVISLDFELFWGVGDSKTIATYGSNILGVWKAVPAILAIFKKYEIRCSWATVGMVMCRDYHQWAGLRPSLMPTYDRVDCSTYALGPLAQEWPKLFFARDLVEEIVSTPHQELASHTYSHFYCNEPGVTVQQLAADLECAQAIGEEVGCRLDSLVFPRNQVRQEFLVALPGSGIKVYRGNPTHWVYRDGHKSRAGDLGRLVRVLDSWLPLSGQHVAHPRYLGNICELSASHFLRPHSPVVSKLDWLRLGRLKDAMTAAARAGGVFHLWWHPHNFGRNLEQNLAFLESLLKHFQLLHDAFGMTSANMRDFAKKDLACTHI